MFVAHLVSESIKTKQETNCKGRARAQARARRQISDVVNLNPFVHFHKLQTAADRGMLKATVLIDVFYLRIGDAAVIFEKRRQVPAGDVARLIDRRRQYSTAKFAEPNRIVGSSAEKRDSKWGTGYNHAITFLLALSILGCASHSRIWCTESSSDDAVMST